jgi:uncharacterized damage-inducible protein DinB
MAEEGIKLWETFRAGTIAEFENIPEDQWDYRPGEGARSVAELARHIAETNLGFATEIVAEEPSFGRIFDKEAAAKRLAPYAGIGNSKAELIELLRRTGADGMQLLRDAAATLDSTTIKLAGQPQSRVTAIAFASGHEMYHRGQAASYARGVGIVPAMTKQSDARKK